ncbi:MAG: hypothetical protein HYZ53_29445 [Planctomycetes bacterium]|nr:hypothetical protein [Planctomycetota bacterium]
MKSYLWLVFVVGAVVSWGAYVPTLHEGQKLLGGRPSEGALRAFLCVGVAYFCTAVVIPLVLFALKLEPAEFNVRGAGFATLGGALGAAGALCIILSMKNGGSPLYVAPLVFAGAPIMNVLVTMAWKRTESPSPMFYVGIVVAALGAGTVLYYKPAEVKAPPAAGAAAAAGTGASEAAVPAPH